MSVTARLPGGNTPGARAKTVPKSSDPSVRNKRNIAIKNPTTPTRLTRNALSPASALIRSLNQNPIKR